jgi:hypothetical protein
MLQNLDLGNARPTIIDTLTWFPSKVKLPDSSSTDIILSCLQDILHALSKPLPKSPLAPRTGTQTQALHDLIALLGSVSPTTPAPLVTPPTAAVPSTKTNTHLRVRFMPTQPVQASDQSLRVATPNTVPTPTLIPDDASPTVPGLMIDEFLEEQYDAEHSHISPIPFGFEGCIPQQPPSSSLRVLSTAATEPDTPATEQPAPSPPTPSRNQRPRRRNRKPARRSRRIQQSSHAFSTGPTTATSKLFTDSFTSHFAMHGTAVNPDTGGIAEYKELSTCSDGTLWQASNADKIGRMFQGLGPDSYMPTGTNTLFFIDKKDIPKNKKPTYVRVVCANRPEKTNPERQQPHVHPGR